MVVVEPEPVIPPGFIVHVPEGKPPKTTLPVATEQLGCVTETTIGAGGVPGFAIITTLADGNEVQPKELVTV